MYQSSKSVITYVLFINSQSKRNNSKSENVECHFFYQATDTMIIIWWSEKKTIEEKLYYEKKNIKKYKFIFDFESSKKL